MRSRALTLKLMSNLLHETCGSKDIDLQAENDWLRSLLEECKHDLEVVEIKLASLTSDIQKVNTNNQ